jgi:hypothetical protein
MGGALWCYGTQEEGCTNHSFIHSSLWFCTPPFYPPPPPPPGDPSCPTRGSSLSRLYLPVSSRRGGGGGEAVHVLICAFVPLHCHCLNFTGGTSWLLYLAVADTRTCCHAVWLMAAAAAPSPRGSLSLFRRL